MGAKLGSEQDRVKDDPTDEELMELINKEYPIEKAQYVFEAGTKIFNLSLDEFIEIFYARNSQFSFAKLYEIKQFKDIKIEEGKSEREGHEAFVITCIIPITGVPFCRQTRLIRNFTVSREG